MIPRRNEKNIETTRVKKNEWVQTSVFERWACPDKTRLEWSRTSPRQLSCILTKGLKNFSPFQDRFRIFSVTNGQEKTRKTGTKMEHWRISRKVGNFMVAHFGEKSAHGLILEIKHKKLTRFVDQKYFYFFSWFKLMKHFWYFDQLLLKEISFAHYAVKILFHVIYRKLKDTSPPTNISKMAWYVNLTQ